MSNQFVGWNEACVPHLKGEMNGGMVRFARPRKLSAGRLQRQALDRERFIPGQSWKTDDGGRELETGNQGTGLSNQVWLPVFNVHTFIPPRCPEESPHEPSTDRNPTALGMALFDASASSSSVLLLCLRFTDRLHRSPEGINAIIFPGRPSPEPDTQAHLVRIKVSHAISNQRCQPGPSSSLGFCLAAFRPPIPHLTRLLGGNYTISNVFKRSNGPASTFRSYHLIRGWNDRHSTFPLPSSA